MSKSTHASTDNQPLNKRREQVLQAAIRVFHKKGYRSATIQDIAAEMKFTAAALYYYIDSKQDLLKEVILEPGTRLLAMSEGVLAGGLPPVQKLRQLVRGHLNIMLRDRPLFAILLRERVELPSVVAVELAQLDHDYYEVFRNLIVEAAETGELHVEAPAVTALALIGMVNWTLHWYSEDAQLQIDDLAEMLFHIFYEGTAPTRAHSHTTDHKETSS